jgi:hypothetical protein
MLTLLTNASWAHLQQPSLKGVLRTYVVPGTIPCEHGKKGGGIPLPRSQQPGGSLPTEAPGAAPLILGWSCIRNSLWIQEASGTSLWALETPWWIRKTVMLVSVWVGQPFGECTKRNSLSFLKLTHTCNPSYSGGRDQEDLSLKSAWANSSQGPISKIPNTKQDWQE